MGPAYNKHNTVKVMGCHFCNSIILDCNFCLANWFSDLLALVKQTAIFSVTLWTRWQRTNDSLWQTATKELRPSAHKPLKKEILPKPTRAWKQILFQLNLQMRPKPWLTPRWQSCERVRSRELSDSMCWFLIHTTCDVINVYCLNC